MHLASTLQTFLSTHWRVSRTQFTVGANTLVADVLQVVHDYILFCWSRGQKAAFGGCHACFRFPSACHYPVYVVGGWLLGRVSRASCFHYPTLTGANAPPAL